MNYLSHFFIDRIPGDHYFNTGLLLPDVTKGLVKNFRTPVTGTAASDRLYAGCLKHYESDRAFHNSGFFKGWLEKIGEALKTAPFTADLQRRWFLAHIMVELFIDRLIIRHYPSQADDFYTSLSSIDDSELKLFLKAYGISDPQHFFTNFDHFRTVRFIYYYTDHNKFVYSLNRIMLRAGLKGMGDEDTKVMTDLVMRLDETYFSNTGPLTGLKNIFG